MNVSVFITSYNQKKLLRGAIESVLRQTRMPDEVVIADDYSTDGSRGMISDYKSEYPKLIKTVFQKENLGIPRNKNAAYRATSGELVTYLDGDDRFRPNKIKVDLDTLRTNPEADIACANVEYIDVDGSKVGTWCEDEEEMPTGDVAIEVLARDFPKRSLFRNEMVKKEKVAKVGFYDTDLPLYEDWDLRIRLLQKSRLAYSHQVTSEYRKNPHGISSTHAGRHLDACSRVYRKHRSKIESLKESDRRYVNRCVRPWIGQFAWRAFRNAVYRRDWPTAWLYLQDSMKYDPQSIDVRALAQFCLPESFITTIRSLRN